MSKLVEAAAEFLSRDTSTKQSKSLYEEMAGKTKKDQEYAMDYDTGRGEKALHKALNHAKQKGYKINHDGAERDIGKHEEHEKPDVTFTYARGDDSPNAYTVHHDGAAANDHRLHVKSLHMQD